MLCIIIFTRESVKDGKLVENFHICNNFSNFTNLLTYGNAECCVKSVL